VIVCVCEPTPMRSQGCVLLNEGSGSRLEKAAPTPASHSPHTGKRSAIVKPSSHALDCNNRTPTATQQEHNISERHAGERVYGWVCGGVVPAPPFWTNT
jgi:hypothetical protein